MQKQKKVNGKPSRSFTGYTLKVLKTWSSRTRDTDEKRKRHHATALCFVQSVLGVSSGTVVVVHIYTRYSSSRRRDGCPAAAAAPPSSCAASREEARRALSAFTHCCSCSLRARSPLAATRLNGEAYSRVRVRTRASARSGLGLRPVLGLGLRLQLGLG